MGRHLASEAAIAVADMLTVGKVRRRALILPLRDHRNIRSLTMTGQRGGSEL